MKHIIYAADNEEYILDLIRIHLEKENYEVVSFTDGLSLADALSRRLPDLLVMDISLKGQSGKEILKSLRAYSDLPVIIVSAKCAPSDRVDGLELGCDDYICKPFLPRELVLRIGRILDSPHALPSPEEYPEELCLGNLKILPDTRQACIGDKPFRLTPLEFDFLAYLLRRKGAAVSRQELIREVWQQNWGQGRMPDDLLKRLRRKMAAAGCTAAVETVWGYGCRLSEKIQPSEGENA